MIDDANHRQRLHRGGHVAQRVQPLSAGAIRAVWAIKHTRAVDLRGEPIDRQIDRNPGIDSSLSSVPPVWPEAAARHHRTASRTGDRRASGIEILSPTPPVECLSILARAISATDRSRRPSGSSRRPTPPARVWRGRGSRSPISIRRDLVVRDAPSVTPAMNRDTRRRRARRRRASCGLSWTGSTGQ